MKKKKIVNKILIYLLMAAVGLVFVFPVYWIFTKAINGAEGILSYPPELIPKRVNFENFKYANDVYGIYKQLLNSTFVSTLSVLGATLSSLFVAYGFARMRFKGKAFLFTIVLASMMLPWDILVIPQFIGFTKLGLTDSYIPLILPYCFGYPFYIFLMRQFIMGIPYEIDEAAYIDGCSKLGIFFRMIMPLMKPVMATVVVYHFLLSWNDFLNPLVYISSSAKYTISLGIYYMKDSVFGVDWPAIMAGGAIAVIVPLIVFIFAQKQLIEGISRSGLKG
ncbi:MAG: carbohydrate ABC transporter permease [Clostridia bacterium]|nr:carbohydrate ABC transporter permease [Clostridia bacterium]